MKALKDDIPDDGTPFPNGARMTKIDWPKQSNTVSPYPVEVQNTLKSASFMVKGSKR